MALSVDHNKRNPFIKPIPSSIQKKKTSKRSGKTHLTAEDKDSLKEKAMSRLKRYSICTINRSFIAHCVLEELTSFTNMKRGAISEMLRI
ncbi:hypothetical protein ACS0TY_026446 [Phlomoides rotata]